ncbi:MAG: phosphoribosyltransferase [Candidatus Kariarchaeaceae archaeon]|jgi:hypoxanthine phosphoribosyltransferase
MVEYLIFNWQDAYDKIFRLYEQLKNSKYEPDIIVGVARGGWIPARLIADFYCLKVTANIKVEAYELIGETDVEAKITQDINIKVGGKKLLIVDDIADSGASLKVVLDKLKVDNPAEIKTATLFYKPHSVIKPDHFVEQTNSWVVFPWEIFETIQELSSNMKADGKSLAEIKEELKNIGLPAGMVEVYFSYN